MSVMLEMFETNKDPGFGIFLSSIIFIFLMKNAHKLKKKFHNIFVFCFRKMGVMQYNQNMIVVFIKEGLLHNVAKYS